MKYRAMGILVLMSLLIISACGSPSSGSIYNDGTYIAEGDHRDDGYEIAEVTIKNDEIVDIVLKRMDASGNEVDYTKWNGEEADGVTIPDLDYIRKNLAITIVEKRTTDVDLVSGATISSDGWINAVERALNQAKK